MHLGGQNSQHLSQYLSFVLLLVRLSVERRKIKLHQGVFLERRLLVHNTFVTCELYAVLLNDCAVQLLFTEYVVLSKINFESREAGSI